MESYNKKTNTWGNETSLESVNQMEAIKAIVKDKVYIKINSEGVVIDKVLTQQERDQIKAVLA